MFSRTVIQPLAVLAVVTVIANACALPSPTPALSGGPPGSDAPASADTNPSALPVPSLDTAAVDQLDAGCQASDDDYVAGGGTTRIGPAYAVEAADDDAGRWVLLYSDGERWLTCFQQPGIGPSEAPTMSTHHVNEPATWSEGSFSGGITACTAWSQFELFFCVGRADPSAVQVELLHPDTDPAQAVTAPNGDFVVVVPYVPAMTTGFDSGSFQLNTIDSCGHNRPPVTADTATPCPRPG